MIKPFIGANYILKESAWFEEIETDKRISVAQEMSDEKQGAWAEGPQPYEAGPFIITVDGFVLTDPLEPIRFENTNQEIQAVVWQSPIGFWYKANIEDLQNL